MIVNVVKVMEALDQLPRPFRTDARNAGNVVGRVALDRLDVDELSRLNAVILANLLLVVDRHLRLSHLRGGETYRHAAADQLQAVAVAGSNHALRALLPADAGKGAEDIVRLETIALDQTIAEQAQKLLEIRQLLGELLRHSLSRRLVARIRLVAESRSLPIKGNGDGVRLRLGAQPLQHRQKAIDSVCIQTVLRGQNTDPVEGAVQNAVSVQDQKLHVFTLRSAWGFPEPFPGMALLLGYHTPGEK